MPSPGRRTLERASANQESSAMTNPQKSPGNVLRQTGFRLATHSALTLRAPLPAKASECCARSCRHSEKPLRWLQPDSIHARHGRQFRSPEPDIPKHVVASPARKMLKVRNKYLEGRLHKG